MKTAEQKLNEKLREAKAALKEARQRNRAARRLLTRALDALPDYMDGRNDKLANAMQKWLQTHAD